jgi:hypothetical protein
MTNCSVCNTGFLLVGLACSNCGVTNCATCSAVGSCTSCKPAFYLSGTDSAAICTACSSSCLSCTSAGCQTCNSGRFLRSNLTCGACSAGCTTCTSATACTACGPSYVISGKVCVACSQGCLTCTSTTCSSCDTVKNYQLSNGVCVCLGTVVGTSCE